MSEEALAERAVRSGAWKCLFFLIRELSLKKTDASFNDSLAALAAETGWNAEYRLVEPHVLQLLAGNSVDVNAVVANVLAAANKSAENSLLIATDESYSLHIPLVKKPADERMRQLAEQSETEERVKLLVGTPPFGLLLMDSFLQSDQWLANCCPAKVSDILRVHEYSYVRNIIEQCAKAAEQGNSEGKVGRERRLQSETGQGNVCVGEKLRSRQENRWSRHRSH